MRSFREKLRTWIYPRHIKLYVWLHMLSVRKAGALIRICARILDFEIRALEPTFLQIGEIGSDDNLVEYVSRVLTQRPVIGGIDDVAHERSQLAMQLIDRARSSGNVREIVSTYFLTQAFLASLAMDENKMNVCLSNAREFHVDAQPFDVGSLYKAYAKAKTRDSILRRALAERSAIKIEVSLSNLVSLLGVASAVLVIAGYLYTTTLLDAFGVDASIFFSLPDYLAASLEQIRNAGYSAGFGLLFFVLGIRQSSIRSRSEHQARLKQRRSEDVAMFLIVTVTAAVVAIEAYHGRPEFTAIETLGVLVAYALADKISGMFFKQWRPVFIFLSVLLVFSALVGGRLYEQIFDLKSGRWRNDVTKLSLKIPLSVPDDSLVIITANSNFVFALSKEDRSVYVIPRDNVKLIKVGNTF